METQQFGAFDADTDSGLSEQILPKGAILDNRYEIIKILGIGGMGSVYLAQDLRFSDIKRFCAIKEMISATPDPEFRKTSLATFRREANTLASLNHPAILKIFDNFTEGNRAYLVTEFVDGETLEDTLNQLGDDKFLDEDRVIRWGIEICDILTFLHNSKTPIVYRDLKPSNLMLRQEGDSVVLIDFGIAKAFQEGQKGTMMGTEGYSPPEQYRGLATPQGDIYALGATLHHLITRRDPKLEPPFTFHEALPRQLNPDISQYTEQVIMKSLNYEAKNRFASAAHMKLALEKVQELKEQGNSQPANNQAQTPPGGQSTAFLQNPPQAPSPYPQPMPPQQGYPPPQTPYPQQYPQHPQYPQQAPPGYPMPQQPGYPQQPMDAPNFNTIQNDIVPIWVFKCEDEIRSSPALGGDTVYVGAYDNNLYAVDAKEGKFKWKYPTEGGIASTPCYVNDRVLIGSEDRQVYAISSRQGKLMWSVTTEGRIRSSVNVEFGHAFFGSDDGQVYAANVQSGRVVWRFDAGKPVRSTPVIDNEIVYVGCDDGHLYAIDMQTGGIKWKFRTLRPIWSSPVIYQDLVLFGSQDNSVYAVDKASGWSIWSMRTNKPVISSPTIHNHILYIGSVDGSLYALNVSNGKVIWRFKAGGQIASKPAVSNEAVFFGTSEGQIISISVKSGKEIWRFQTQGPVPSSPTLGNNVLYIGSTDHNLYALPA